MVGATVKRVVWKTTMVLWLAGGTWATAEASAIPTLFNVNQLTITGGHFKVSNKNTDPAIRGGPGAPIIAGTYQGGTGTPTEPNPSESLTTFNFLSYPVYTFTAASAAPCVVGSSCTNTGSITGGPAPTGTVNTVNGGTIAMDMSSWFASWDGYNFSQGGSATGTYDTSTGAYTLSWQSTIDAPGWNESGYVGHWTLTGMASVTAVPLPATVWLMGSGLLGVVGFAGRKRQGAAAKTA